jgi:hypothetical protein
MVYIILDQDIVKDTLVTIYADERLQTANEDGSWQTLICDLESN